MNKKELWNAIEEVAKMKMMMNLLRTKVSRCAWERSWFEFVTRTWERSPGTWSWSDENCVYTITYPYSRKEYVDDGRYMTRRAREGIFRAADFDRDGFVTRAEYVNNRIITDEAKEIFDDMDADGDRRLTVDELVGSGKLRDEALARDVFRALDTDDNGTLVIPEYLRVWGRWARSEVPQPPR